MKRALVVAGSSVKGAYSAGVIKYLLGNLKRDYDVLCGISSGALTVGQLAMYKKDEHEAAANALYETWSNSDHNAVFKMWCPLGPIEGFWKSSFVNSQPLIDHAHRMIDVNKIRENGREVRVGATSLTGGKYHIFTQNDDNLVECMLASSAIPGVFIPHLIDGQFYIDGAMMQKTPIAAAIEAGADEIDVVMTDPEDMTDATISRPNSVGVLMRAADIVTTRIIENDLALAHLYNTLLEQAEAAGANALPKLAGKRKIKINIFRPPHRLDVQPVYFTKDKLQVMASLGYENTKLMFEPIDPYGV